MKFPLAIGVSCLLTSACTTTRDPVSTQVLTAEQVGKQQVPRVFLRAQARYEQLASQPTPSSWAEGAVWAFEFGEYENRAPLTIKVRVSAEPGTACLSGNWKKLVVLEDSLHATRDPVFSVNGRNLQILLSNALCDAYDTLDGELSGSDFSGKRNFSHMLGGDSAGEASGHAVEFR